MSYHVENTRFKELPEQLIVNEDGYIDAYKREGEPIVDYVYILGGGECDAILDKSYYKGIHGYCECMKCSNCGEPLFSEFKSCPWCGMTIRKAVKQ